jgi:hypothetical protein
MAEVVGGVRGTFNMKGRSYLREDICLVCPWYREYTGDVRKKAISNLAFVVLDQFSVLRLYGLLLLPPPSSSIFASHPCKCEAGSLLLHNQDFCYF